MRTAFAFFANFFQCIFGAKLQTFKGGVALAITSIHQLFICRRDSRSRVHIVTLRVGLFMKPTHIVLLTWFQLDQKRVRIRVVLRRGILECFYEVLPLCSDYETLVWGACYPPSRRPF